jgi:hypothetical protein
MEEARGFKSERAKRVSKPRQETDATQELASRGRPRDGDSFFRARANKSSRQRELLLCLSRWGDSQSRESGLSCEVAQC